MDGFLEAMNPLWPLETFPKGVHLCRRRVLMTEDTRTFTVSCRAGPLRGSPEPGRRAWVGQAHGKAGAADPQQALGWPASMGGTTEGTSAAAGPPGTFGWKQLCGEMSLRNALPSDLSRIRLPPTCDRTRGEWAESQLAFCL